MKEKINQIIKYINNYNENNNQNQIIDYYKVFELPTNSTINTLKQEIKAKKLKILFHPDLTAYIPNDYKEKFIILSDAVKDMENVFDNDKNKEKYDENLKKQYEDNNKKVNITDKEINEFNDIISTNIIKHGFDFTYKAIINILEQNYFKGITKTNDCRQRLFNLGSKKIKTILTAFQKQNQDTSSININIISYFSFLLYQNDELMKKMNSYIDACIKTYYKYGIKNLEWAITEEIKKSIQTTNVDDSRKYIVFTNDGLARENLRKNVPNRKDLMTLTLMYLNINQRYEYKNIDMSKLNIEEIIVEFIKILDLESPTKNRR